MGADWPTWTVDELVAQGVLARPVDGNHGEILPKKADFVPVGVPFITAANLVNGRVDTRNCHFITEEQASSLRKGFAQSGDVLLTHKATLGRTAIVDDLSTPYVVLTPQVTYYRVLDDGALSNRYLKYYFDSRGFQQLFDAWAHSGSTRAYLGITAQRKLPILLPPIGEQRAIARILGALDDKIELNRKMNRTLEAMAQATFKSWFVDFDPVTAKRAQRSPFGMDADTAALFPDRFVDAEIGPIPHGWKVGSIADIARYVNGRNFTKEATGTGRMVIRIAELNSGPGGSTKYNDVEASDDNTAFPDDVLFAWSGSLGVYRWHRSEALINQHIFKVICTIYPKWFVYFHLREAMNFFRAVAAGKATTMGHIKRTHLGEAELALPPTDRLELLNSRVEPVFAKVHVNELESRTLADLRDTLLPRLLSGEIGVDLAEEAVEEAV